MSSRRRGGGDINPKLHMDRQPIVTRINDPSLPAGKRREIDNVMKKARATANGYWDKKLLEVEEKDPNRWRHTGYKKMYIEGETSSGESDREPINRDQRGYNTGGGGGLGPPASSGRYGRSRSPRVRKSPPLSPPGHRDMMDNMSRGRMSPISSNRGGGRAPRSPDRGPPRSPIDMGNRRPIGGRPRSPPPEPSLRRCKSRSPIGGRRRASPLPMGMSSGSGNRRRTPPPPVVNNMNSKQRSQILPRSKRPPSPPPRNACRSRSNSSVSSCSDESCSECSPRHRYKSQSASVSRSRGGGPRSPPPKASARGPSYQRAPIPHSSSSMHRPSSPPRGADKYHRTEVSKVRRVSRERSLDVCNAAEGLVKVTRPTRHSPPEDPRLKNRPPEPPEPASSSAASSTAPTKKKKKTKELRTRIKIEGEKRKKHSSSESDDSGGSDSDDPALPTFTATTRLTLSERFAKMAQWSIDRSNMENMRITKDSVGGALKVMIQEGIETPPRRFSYSPAPAGHFPEELATTAPSGMLSWDDVRVRYDYYKSRGYLRDLDLKDYIKWEEWWYKYQEWLKHERYYEYWERQQIARRRRKKLPMAQRLN